MSLIVVVGALSSELTGGAGSSIETRTTVATTVAASVATSDGKSTVSSRKTSVSAADKASSVTAAYDSTSVASTVAASVTLLADVVSSGLLSLFEAAGLVIETGALVVRVGVRKSEAFLVAELLFASMLFSTRGSVVVVVGALTLLPCGLFK